MREKSPEQRQQRRKLTLRRAAQDNAVAAIDKPCLARVDFISIQRYQQIHVELVRVPQGRKLGHQRVVRTPEPLDDLFHRQP